MKDQFTNHMESEEAVSETLKSVAQNIEANPTFKAELEKQLMQAHQPANVNSIFLAFNRAMPTIGWTVALAVMALVLNWVIRSIAPPPMPAANETLTPSAQETPSPISTDENATPVPDDGGYDFRGTKLYLAQPLPESPAEANVYLLKEDQHATVEEARALAQQFGINGEVYNAPGELPNTTGYLVTDGRQRLYARSNNYFTYYSDYGANTILLGGKNITQDQASAAIEAFLKSRDFDFKYQIAPAIQLPGAYYVMPLTADGYAIRYDYNLPARLTITLDNNGQVIMMDSDQINYQLVGAYGLIAPEEAFQKLFGTSQSSQNGVLEIMHSGGILNESFWTRYYPDNETITIYGRVTAFDSVDPSQPTFVSIDSYTATGNTPPASDQLMEATGQFYIENGIRKFNVETWKITDATETSISGTLQREGNQTILLSDMGERYALTDVPADVPFNTKMPDEQLNFNGVIANGNLIWTSIQYFPAGSNFGGGGGGGTGFYKLNLSGTPVVSPTITPFPNPTFAQTNQGTVEYVVQEEDTLLSIAQTFWTTPERILQANGFSSGDVLMPGITIIIPDIPGVLAGLAPLGKRIEGLRGNISITIYKKPDESQRAEYILVYIPTDKQYSYMSFQMLLQGMDLQSLQAYQNRPIEIWGTISGYDEQNLLPIVNVERFNIPFPDLNFQILKGRQRNVTINGEDVVLFTTEEGATYVQSDGLGDVNCCLLVGNEGDDVWVEALIVPGDAFGDYPLLRVFNWGSQPTEFTSTSDQPYIMDEALSPENYVPPSVTIEKVELVYYIPDPRYVIPDPNATPQYIQPAWRFYGHYSNGDEFEILVQALKEEFLLPELAPYTPPG